MSRPFRIVAAALALAALYGMSAGLRAQKAPGGVDKVPVSRENPAAAVPPSDNKNLTGGSGAAIGNTNKEANNRTYDFNSMLSKRDPFKSLIKKNEVVVDQSPEAVKRPGGIRGMLISELKLIGLAKGLSGENIAVMMGNDQKAHFMKAGDRVWDGFIENIDDTAVLFRKETKRAAGPPRRQDVKLYLYPPIQQ